MAREVSLLMGERAPPVSMMPMQPKYKQRPRRALKAAPWSVSTSGHPECKTYVMSRDLAPFRNSARIDDLVLRHWVKKQTPKSAVPADGSTDAPAPAAAQAHDEYKFAKYIVQINTPTYTDDIYTSDLTDEDWTKHETDYLVATVRDYSQKWPLVYDRYDYLSPSTSDEPPAPSKQRTMEDLKARYYHISAKMLAHNTPVQNMNRQQYALYEVMKNFDGPQETMRKQLAEKHLHRTELEVQEETALLAELQRIMMSQQKLEAERRELRERLDYPHAAGTDSAQYLSSQGLTQLFQQLLSADRLRKDRRLKEHPGSAPSAQSSNSHAHRDSVASASAVTNKRLTARDSVGSAIDLEPRTRTLSPRSAEKFYVTTHDRLASGVSFASDKLSKSRHAKSAIQTERIAAILRHLKIPDIVPLPTQPVVEAFESVMSKVHELLDMRKLAEKEEQEIKVRKAEKDIRIGTLNSADTKTDSKTSEKTKAEDAKKKAERQAADVSEVVDAADGAEADVTTTEDQTQIDDSVAANENAASSTRGQKRSASVLSTTSLQSSKRTKNKH